MIFHLNRRVREDFIELCYRFSQLVNPCMHLQRSLQQSLPSLRFWPLASSHPAVMESWMGV